jgi:outer membrane protein OmpA-like peptidoglycan-associated protein
MAVVAGPTLLPADGRSDAVTRYAQASGSGADWTYRTYRGRDYAQGSRESGRWPDWGALRRDGGQPALAPQASSPEQLYRQALADLDAGDSAGARGKLEALIARHPNDPVAAEARLRLLEMHAAGARGQRREQARIPVFPAPPPAVPPAVSATRQPELPTPRLVPPPPTPPAAVLPPAPQTKAAIAPALPAIPVAPAAPGALRKAPGSQASLPSSPEPPQQQPIARDGDFKLAVGDRVFFDEASAALGPRERAVLAAQASWLRNRSEVIVTLEAHADEPGAADLNRVLSSERAEAVKAILVKEGVNPERIRIAVLGNTQPVAICQGAARSGCAAQNRRVVSIVTWPSGAEPRRVGAAASSALQPQASGGSSGRPVTR